MRLKLLVLYLALLLCAGTSHANEAQSLRIFSTESKPLAFMNEGRPDGFMVELMHALQDRIGRHDALEIVPWARATMLAEAGPNAMLLFVARTPERERNLQFIGPVFSTQLTAFALKGKAAEWRRQKLDFQQLRGGARRGTIFATQARAQGFNVIEEASNAEIAAKMLINGRFDLWFDAEELMADTVRSAGYDPDQLEVAFRRPGQSIYIAFSKGVPQAVVRTWNEALSAMKRDGSFLKIHRKWLPSSQLPLDVKP